MTTTSIRSRRTSGMRSGTSSFGLVRIEKNDVSYHLMPVYMYPDLLDDLPEG